MLGRQQADHALRQQHVRVHPGVVLVEQGAGVPPRALHQPGHAARVEAQVGRHIVHLPGTGCERGAGMEWESSALYFRVAVLTQRHTLMSPRERRRQDVK